jgi:hypothetical protein
LTQPVNEERDTVRMTAIPEMTLEQVAVEIARLKVDLDFCIRYVQTLAIGMGLKEQVKMLDDERAERLKGDAEPTDAE